MEKKWLALSVAALLAVQPMAGVMASNGGNSGSGGPGGSNVSVFISLDSAAEAAQDAVDALEATNEITADEILAVVTEIVAPTGIEAEWTTPFEKTDATADASGSVTGEITLTWEEETAKVTVDLVIAQLEEEESPLAEAKAAAEAALAELEVNNTLAADAVKAAVLEAVQTVVGADVQAAWAKKADSEDDDVTVTLAASLKAGSVKGNILLTAGDATETVAVDLAIAALPAETLEQVAGAVETALGSYKVANTLETEEAVKEAVLTYVTEQVNGMMKGVTTAWAQRTSGEEVVDDVAVVLPTTEKAGSVNGFIELSKPGEVTDETIAFLDQDGSDTTLTTDADVETAIVEVKDLTIDQIVEENEDLLAAKQEVEEALEDLTLTNSSQEEKLLAVLKEAVTNSDVDLTWSKTEGFHVEPATTSETGLITGTILISLRGQSQQVVIEKEIAKLAENQIDTQEAADRIEKELESFETSINTDEDDVNSMLRNLFVGTYIGYRWGTSSQERFEKVASTTSQMGRITGTVYVYEIIDTDSEEGDVTSELPVRINLYLPKRTSNGSGSGSGSGSGGNRYTNTNNTYTVPGNTTVDDNTDDENNTSTPQKKQFADLGNYAWAQAQIDALVEKGVINGVSDTEFAPANNIKRADFLVMAMRLAGLNDTPTDNFADVPAGSYYYNAVGIAKQLGITSGAGNNQFLPETNITRQDMFVLAYNLLKNQGVITTDADVSVLDSFADAADVADYAKVAVATLMENGFINGDDANRINPVNNATRAESAVFLYNVSQKMN